MGNAPRTILSKEESYSVVVVGRTREQLVDSEHCLAAAQTPGSGSVQALGWGYFLSLSYTKISNRILVVRLRQTSPMTPVLGWVIGR